MTLGWTIMILGTEDAQSPTFGRYKLYVLGISNPQKQSWKVYRRLEDFVILSKRMNNLGHKVADLDFPTLRAGLVKRRQTISLQDKITLLQHFLNLLSTILLHISPPFPPPLARFLEFELESLSLSELLLLSSFRPPSTYHSQSHSNPNPNPNPNLTTHTSAISQPP